MLHLHHPFTPIFDPSSIIQPRSGPPSGHGAYNYNAAQLQHVTGDGIRVTSVSFDQPALGVRPVANQTDQ